MKSPLFHLVQSVKCWENVWSWTLKDCIEIQEKKMKVVVLCSRPPQNVKFGIFTTYSRAVTAKKRTKERDARTNFFCQSKSIALLPFSLALPSSLLKLPIIVSGCKPDPPLLRSPSCCCYNYYLLLFFYLQDYISMLTLIVIRLVIMQSWHLRYLEINRHTA